MKKWYLQKRFHGQLDGFAGIEVLSVVLLKEFTHGLRASADGVGLIIIKKEKEKKGKRN